MINKSGFANSAVVLWGLDKCFRQQMASAPADNGPGGGRSRDKIDTPGIFHTGKPAVPIIPG
jgi:hypothetical protein